MKTVRPACMLLATAAVLGCAPVSAQEPEGAPSPGEILDAFAQPGSPGPARFVEVAAMHPEQLPPATVDAIMDGLAGLVADAPDARKRSEAFAWLYQAGDITHPYPVDGVVRRLREAFLRSQDIVIREEIARYMRRQAEVQEALALLEEVAVEQNPIDRSNDWPAAYSAVQTLSTMGPEGEGILRRLYAIDAVHNWRARARLEFLSHHGFRDTGPGRPER